MSSSQYPYTYLAYGLQIISQVPVIGFRTASVSRPDVTIMLGEVPQHLANVVNRGVLFESNEREFLMHIDKVAGFHAINGDLVRIQPHASVNTDDMSAFISGTVFGALLHQRNMFPIHASTVYWKAKCLVFAGTSSSGKSTLAAAIIQAGGMLVADDISVIGFDNKKPEVIPAFPMIRIWEDSLKHLGIPFEHLRPVRAELKKYYMPVLQYHDSSAWIDHFFVIGSHNRENIESREIAGINKFMILKKHTYLFRGIRDTMQQQQHFALVNQLASCICVTVIKRPNGDFNTRKLVDYISDIITR